MQIGRVLPGMSTLASKPVADAVDVKCTDDELIVTLVDGRRVSAPLAWFPRLLHATPKQRANWRLIGRGIGIYWEDVDEARFVKIHPMKITRQIVADKIADYLHGKVSQAELVDWAERALMDADFDEADTEVLTDIVGRLGLADVAEFGLRWQARNAFAMKSSSAFRIVTCLMENL